MTRRVGSIRVRRVALALAFALAGCNDILGIAPLTSPDGGGGGDGGSSDWCAANAPNAAACLDFDGPQGFAGWQPQTPSHGETGVLDGVTFRSPPRALTVTTPALSSSSTYAQWCLARSFPGSRSVSFAFDLRVDTIDPGGAYVTVADLALAGAPPSAGTHVAFAIDRVGAHVLVLDGPRVLKDTQLAAAPGIVVGVWTRVALELQRDPDGGAATTVSVLFDGKMVSADGGSATTFDLNGSGDTTVDVGGCYVSAPSAEQVVHVDDVVVDVR